MWALIIGQVSFILHGTFKQLLVMKLMIITISGLDGSPIRSTKIVLWIDVPVKSVTPIPSGIVLNIYSMRFLLDYSVCSFSKDSASYYSKLYNHLKLTVKDKMIWAKRVKFEGISGYYS